MIILSAALQITFLFTVVSPSICALSGISNGTQSLPALENSTQPLGIKQMLVLAGLSIVLCI